MTKLLWFSNFCFRESASAFSGTWIEAMGKGILATGKYSIVNVSLSGVKKPTLTDACGVIQWELPFKQLDKKGNPPHWMIEKIKEIEREVQPDLIHVWGTERFWCQLTARHELKSPVLLEMQGITSAIAPYVTGCLMQKDLSRCYRLKEMLKPQVRMDYVQNNLAESVAHEQEIYAGHRFIDYESEWVKSYLLPYASEARFFKTRMILRSEFLSSSAWAQPPNNHTVFTTCGWLAAKGLHTLINACAMLKREFPDIRLVIAGECQTGIRQGGYTKWAMRKLSESGIDYNILGAVDAAHMIEEMHHAGVFVHPSLVESYSMSLAEAMAVGCPCVASYAGAMPEVGGDACLYFPIADSGACAGRIRELFCDHERATALGKAARLRSLEMHDDKKGVARQCEIYEAILS